MAAPSGTTSASLIVLLVVATIIGAITALLLDGLGFSGRLLAILSGLVATLVASVARYKVIFLGAGAGPDDRRVPMVVVVNAAVASIAGSLAARDIASYIYAPPSAVFVGAVAGLLSAVLLAMLMITYHMNPSGGGRR